MSLSLVLSTMLLGFPAACDTGDATTAPSKKWEIRDGRFYDNGEWMFLKVAKPLRNFGDENQVDQLIADLDYPAAKGL